MTRTTAVGGQGMLQILLRWQIASVFLLALVVRLGATQIFQGLGSAPDGSANPDQIDYEEFAHQMSIGHGYARASGELTAARAPGTSFTLLPVYLAFGRSWVLSRVWFCMLSAATCGLCAAIARRLFGGNVGLLAGVWLALYPGHFYYSMHLLSEVIYGFWLCLAMVLYLRARSGGSFLQILCGAALGLSVLTRPQALLLFPWMALVPLLEQRGRRGAAVQKLLLQWTAAACVVAPWIVRNQRVLGKATITTIGGYTFWGANNATVLSDPSLAGAWIPVDSLIDADHPVEGNEVEREQATYRHAWRFVRENLGEMPRLALMKIWRLLSPMRETSNSTVFVTFAVTWILTGPLMLLGLFWIARRDRFALMLLLAPLLVTLATAVIYYGSIRFRDSVAPIFVIPAAFAALEIKGRWSDSKRGRRDPV